MQLTDEQLQIVGSNANLLKVNAFAGTGKTSTLVKYAEARPKDRILYLAFNKAIQQEAQGKFPARVQAATSHALAFAKFGKRYADQLIGNLKANQVAEALDLSNRRKYTHHFAMLAGQQVIQTLVRFFASADDSICVEHVNMPPEAMTTIPYTADDVRLMTEELWAMMQDPANDRVGMLHDGYLKLFQMSRPTLPYDIILFDEAQDANPCTLDIVTRHAGKKVFVGDQHQSIYLFRGAVNAMSEIRADEEFDLTGSFRFGPKIAQTANALLYHLRGEKRKIRGLGGKDDLAPVDRSKPHAVICRSNASVFDEAIVSMSLNRPVAFVGGPQSYTFDKVGDAYLLSIGETNRIRDPYLRSFGSFDNLTAFAETTDDRELKSLSRVVTKYGREIPELVKGIKGRAVEAQRAQVVLTTAHKSKGLEWDQVRLTDDYIDLLTKRGEMPPLTEIRPDELNVLYVAATRAQKRLEVNGSLAAFLKKASLEVGGAITKSMTKTLEKAVERPQEITSSAAIRNLVKAKKSSLREHIPSRRFDPTRDL